MSRAGRSDGDLTKSKILDAAGRLIVLIRRTACEAVIKHEVDAAKCNL